MEIQRLTLGKMQNPVRGFLHGTAAVFALAGTVLLVARVASWGARVSLLVFGLGMIGLFVTSSLYHSVPWQQRWKKRMQRVDHSMIFVLIAGSYTPIAAIVLDGPWRWGTLVGAWGITLIGIGQHILWPTERQTFSVVMTTTLGWLGIFIMVPYAQRAGVMPVVLAGIGGVLYTVGMVFLVTNRPRLWPQVFSYHEVFHVLVIAGSAVHWAMTYRYVTPLAS
jgi:hemolysin III